MAAVPVQLREEVHHSWALKDLAVLSVSLCFLRSSSKCVRKPTITWPLQGLAVL